MIRLYVLKLSTLFNDAVYRFAVHVTDSSDPNWWKGYNERGEGLFPANFVTTDLNAPAPPEAEAAAEAGVGAGRRVQFAEEEEPAAIDEAEMDLALAALHEADPAAPASADAPAAAREARVLRMGPLVDAALERADRRHARLTQLSADLVDALNLYHELMRAPLAGPPAALGGALGGPPFRPYAAAPAGMLPPPALAPPALAPPALAPPHQPPPPRC